MDQNTRGAVAMELRLFANLARNGDVPIARLVDLYTERLAFIIEGQEKPVCTEDARESMRRMLSAGVEVTVARQLCDIRSPKQVDGWVSYALNAAGVTNPPALIVNRLMQDAPAPAPVKPKREEKMLTSDERKALYLGGEYASSIQH